MHYLMGNKDFLSFWRYEFLEKVDNGRVDNEFEGVFRLFQFSKSSFPWTMFHTINVIRIMEKKLVFEAVKIAIKAAWDAMSEIWIQTSMNMIIIVSQECVAKKNISLQCSSP